MTSGINLPPIPDLIPIAALLRADNNPSSDVMGEQRSRRTIHQPTTAATTSSTSELINNKQSRGVVNATPPSSSSQSRNRHRKSARRRRRCRRCQHNNINSKHYNTSLAADAKSPRVNPIFVWVRQEDTHIVDVKCEDYDKRNRILLTKTAHGWRAIPRTETLTLKGLDDDDVTKSNQQHHHHHHRHHHRNRNKRKNKERRKSASCQVDDDDLINDDEPSGINSPRWTSPVNIESHLPSHKIHVPKKYPSPIPPKALSSDVNSESAQTHHHENFECNKICQVVTSPLDNLLAVAEFEFNQQIQSEINNNKKEYINNDKEDKNKYLDFDDDQKEFINNMEQLNSLIDSCTNKNSLLIENDGKPNEDCDYNEDDDNNLAMDDILSRLEQSLRSPENEDENNCKTTKLNEYETTVQLKNCETTTTKLADCESTTINLNNYETTTKENDCVANKLQDCITNTSDLNYFSLLKDEEQQETTIIKTNEDEIVESTSNQENEPTDLSIKPKYNQNECDDLLPTDLSVPKIQLLPSRPQSRNSEAIQSPQPSGIPAVPPSPDIIVTTSSNKIKPSSVFLESLLTKNGENPLDLGKCRKSASPTVTCSSEEMKNNFEPPMKKFKQSPDGITLKTLLDNEILAKQGKPTPKLLELLKTDEPNPIIQLHQILSDVSLNVPDPMLVPKERLSSIISHPAKEISNLLKQRPELRLPEALAFPHLLQDPDILVITLQQLETIILKQNQSFDIKEIKSTNKKPEMAKDRKKTDDILKLGTHYGKIGNFNELANDIDAATTAAFNQMMWLPYLNQLETTSFGHNHEIMKLLSNSALSSSDSLNSNRFPFLPSLPSVPFQQFPLNYPSPLEVSSMWQEAILQANMLRPKNPLLDSLNQHKSNNDYFHKKSHKVNKQHLPNYFENQTMLYQNSLMNFHNYPLNNKEVLQTSHYNPFDQKTSINQQKSNTFSMKCHQNLFETKAAFTNFQQKQTSNKDKSKISCKSFVNVGKNDHKTTHYQPIDLSGSTTPLNKTMKVKYPIIDPSMNLLKSDDNTAEVGSTTASIEDMQDAHKHLWHPLFGNQNKEYTNNTTNNPWNWTTSVIATGE